MKAFKSLMNEASLSRVHTHTQGRNIGMITAHRGENTTEENNKNNAELESHIRKAGYGFVKVKGRYIENHGTDKAKAVDEKSYLVVGKKGDDKGQLLSFLKKHGQKHGQDSILHKAHDSEEAHLHGTREGGYPGMGEKASVGKWHPNRAPEFHTAMKGNRTFAFESFEFLRPVSFSNRQESLF